MAGLIVPILGAIATAAGGAVGGLLGTVITLVGSALASVASLAFGKLGDRRPRSRDPGVPVTARQAVPVRARYYGKSRAAGVWVHGQVIDNNRRFLLMVALSEGPCRGPLAIFFGETKVWERTGEPVNGDVAAFGSYLDGWEEFAYLEWYDGSQTAASSYFVAASAGGEDVPNGGNVSTILTAPTGISVTTASEDRTEIRGQNEQAVTISVTTVTASWTAAAGGPVSAYRVSWTQGDGIRATETVDGATTSLELGTTAIIDPAEAAVTVAAKDASGNWTDAVDAAGTPEAREEIWGSDRIGTGIAYLACDLTWDRRRERFRSGAPNITVQLEGYRGAVDPRTATAGFTRNAGVILRDYLADKTIGLGAAATELVDADWSAQANLCDEVITLASGTEPRYRIDGPVYADEARAEAIRDMAAAQASDVIYSGGLFRPVGGEIPAPVLTITDDDLRGPISGTFDRGFDRTFNTVKGVYRPVETNYVPDDYEPVSDAAYVAEDGEVLFQDLPLPYTTTGTAAKRLARIALKDSRRKIGVTIGLPISAIILEPGDVIAWNSARTGWGARQFEVQRVRIALARGEGVNGSEDAGLIVQVEILEAFPDQFQLNAADAIAQNIGPRERPKRIQLYPPSNVVMDVTTRQGPDGTTLTRSVVTWDASPDAQVTGYDVSYRYDEIEIVQAVTELRFEADRGITEVYVRATAPEGLISQWVRATEAGFDPFDTTPPAAPAGSVVPDTLGRVVAIMDPSPDADFSHFRIYTGAPGDPFASAVLRRRHPSTEIAIAAGLTPGETVRVWATAVDRSGNESVETDLGTAVVGVVLAGDQLTIYADDAVGTNQSADVYDAVNMRFRTHFRIDNYTGAAPVLPVPVPPYFSEIRGGAGSSVLPVYAGSLGDGSVDILDQSLIREAREWFAFAETRNRVERSGGIDKTVWVKVGATAVQDVPAPLNPLNGEANCDDLREDGSTGEHYVEQGIVIAEAGEYTLSWHVAADGRDRVRLSIFHDAVETSAEFDLGAESVTAGDGRIVSVLDNGFYRLALSTLIADAGTPPVIRLSLLDGAGADSYAGDGSSGVTVIACQFEVGELSNFRGSLPFVDQSWSYIGPPDVNIGVTKTGVAFTFEGAPGAAERIGAFVVPVAATVPANFGNSVVRVSTNPGAATVLDVQRGGVSIGTLTIATDGSLTGVTTGGTAITLAADDFLEIIGPDPADASLVDVFLTLYFEIAAE